MFNFSLDKRTITIILVVMLALWLVSSGIAGVLNLLLTVPGVLIAITFHEFAHAWTAVKLGDDTPKRQGRLSLNPFSHMDPVGIILLIVAGFGWGKPVEIDPRNFNGKYSLSKAEAIVAAAGPIMNFILAFVFMIIYYALFAATNALAGLSIMWQNVINYIILYTISINIGLGVFNLIPLPPLDGSKVIMPFLPAKAKSFFIEREQIFYIVFVILWITGLAGYIISPAITFIYKWIINLGLAIFGL